MPPEQPRDPNRIYIEYEASPGQREILVEFDKYAPRIDKKYELLRHDLVPFPDSFVRLPEDVDPTVPLAALAGYGGYGTVVVVKDPLGITRALKILHPANGADHGEGFDLEEWKTAAVRAFSDEILLTNARPFQNVVNIIDYNTSEDAAKRTFAYYVMPFIDGSDFLTFAAAMTVDPTRSGRLGAHDALLGLIDDALHGLEELHAAKVAHLDIKPLNLMVLPPVDAQDRPRLFIIDLGASKAIDQSRTGETPAYFTRAFFSLRLQRELGWSIEHAFVKWDALRRWWQRIDLHCLGRTLEAALLDRGKRRGDSWGDAQSRLQESAKETAWKSLCGEDFEVIAGLVQRLLALDTSAGESRLVTASAARSAFAAIHRSTERAILGSNILTDQDVGMRILTSAALVSIGRSVQPIVEHSQFQRLRHLPQLGLITQVFPDGAHNRFSHSLNAFHLAKRYVLALNRRTQFRVEFDRADVDRVLVAALIHDVGQYHFAHTIEDLRKLADQSMALEATQPTHGTTPLLSILHDQERAAQVLSLPAPGGSLGQVIESCGFPVEDILQLFQKRSLPRDAPTSLTVGRDIVSGVIDVDRVSYLLHDSQRVGVPYGSAVDVASLLDALTMARAEPDSRLELAIFDTGVSAVETILAGVYWMYRNVYWRHTNRAFMAGLKHVFSALLLANKLTFKEYIEGTEGKTEWDALRLISTMYERDGLGHNPLARLLKGQRMGYRRVLTIALDETSNNPLWSAITSGLTIARHQRLVDISAERLGAPPGAVLLDVPMKGRLPDPGAKSARFGAEDAARESVLVVRRDPLTKGVRDAKRIGHVSPLARSLAQAERQHARKIRVFVAAEYVPTAAGTAASEVLAALDSTVRAWS